MDEKITLLELSEPLRKYIGDPKDATTIGGLTKDYLARQYVGGNVDINDTNIKEFYSAPVTQNPSAPNMDWWNIINLPHCHNNGYGCQIAIGYSANAGRFAFRSANGTEWNPWREIAGELDRINEEFEHYVQKAIVLPNGTDVNSIYETGNYRCAAWGGNVPNGIADRQGVILCYLYTGNASSSWCRQIFITPHSLHRYHRFKINNSWSDWKKELLEGDLTPSVIGAAPLNHNHAEYALTGHNHNGTYSLINHGHSGYLTNTGGTIVGSGNGIAFNGKSSNNNIMGTNGDGAGIGTTINQTNLAIRSWQGVGFVNGCSNSGTLNETTVAINCRTGEIISKGAITAKGVNINTQLTDMSKKLSGIDAGANKTVISTYYQDSTDTVPSSGLLYKIQKTGVMGTGNEASGYLSACMSGCYSSSPGSYSCAIGASVISSSACSLAVGAANAEYNRESESTLYSDSTMFVIGGGTPSNYVGGLTRKTVFRVSRTGSVYTSGGSYNTSGADYAEYFEYLDGNENEENRLCLFVTLDGDKIKLANAEDDYILGVISVNPSVIGNSREDEWAGRFETDEYGRVIVEIHEPDEENELLGHESPIESKKYRSNEKYIPRSKRKEWAPVGIIGKLRVIDDGTCEVNGYCYPSHDGIATKCDDRTKGYRVMKRISDNMIYIFLK